MRRVHARAHTSGVTALAVPIAARGGADILLSAARDRVVHRWDLKTHARASTTPTHEACEGLVALDPSAAAGLVGAAAIRAKPDAVYFATAGDKGIVRVWREGSAKPVAASASLSAGAAGAAHAGQDEEGDDAAAGAFTSLHATPSGDGLLAVTGDSRLLFYGAGVGTSRADGDGDGEEGSVVIERELIGNTDEIISAAFLPSSAGKSGAGAGAAPSTALVVATNSPLLRVFDPTTMACTAALGGHSGAILSLDAATGPDGESLVLTGSRDHTVRLWDMTPAAAAVASGRATGEGAATSAGARCLAVGEGHVGAVAAVSLSRRGSPLALSGGADKVARVWDIAGRFAPRERNALRRWRRRAWLRRKSGCTPWKRRR